MLSMAMLVAPRAAGQVWRTARLHDRAQRWPRIGSRIRPKNTESAMIEAKRFAHVTLETPDIERQIAYFTEIAGLALAERHNGRAYLATKHGDLAVTLESGQQARCARLAFQVARDTELAD